MRLAWGHNARPRYLQFLAQERYEELEYLHLRRGFVEGWFLPQFTDARRLRDVGLLSNSAGVDALDGLVWEAEFSRFLPLALLVPAHPGESPREVGAFLVIGAYTDPCPVFVLVREDLMLVPLAASLDDFCSGRCWRGAAPWPHRRLGQPYESYGWNSMPGPVEPVELLRQG
jgi:hypothetical protein